MSNATSVKRKKSLGFFDPVVVTNPPKFHMGPKQFESLEAQGNVVLTTALRKELANLGSGWTANEVARASARPKQFRRLIRANKNRLKAVFPALDLNPDNASPLQRHFVSWLGNHREGSAAADLWGNAAGLIEPVEKLIRNYEDIETSLPADRGSTRRHDDTRYILQLAAIFERAGGSAKAYYNAYTNDGLGDTKFRRFSRAFYAMLPGKGKRKLRGFDTAVVLALRPRKKSRS